MASFATALRALNDLKQADVIREYAIGGAIGVVFWTEPVLTYDLDVFIVLPSQEGPIVNLTPLYQWAARSGYQTLAEHVIVDGVPVQFFPSHNELCDEAIRTAQTLEYEGIEVRVIRPEYLVALWLEPEARTAKRRERAAALMESSVTDQAVLRELLDRYKLSW
ncbi:MAG: hypothetical protein A3G76_00985 [Acidobacteria bacterium RIFCSPLOWO2_12_FULL_65_11]|nr:MAG: hypothetical protein A3G76_00985 [Acidobacteria bacterium RIFCSPLOWO2_12_FULL_65_11]